MTNLMNPPPRCFPLWLVAASAAALALASAASAATLTVFATKTASPGSSPAGQDVDADNRLRAYAAGGQTIDGWMGFDVSEIAALGSPVIVTSARLTLYAEGDLVGAPFVSVQGAPQLGVWHSAHDGWTRGGSGFPSALTANIIASPDGGPFPTATRTAYDINLLASPAANWTGFLADAELSLVLRLANDPSGAHWVYWHGSGERPGDNTTGGHAGGDPVGASGHGAYAPRLVLEYEIVPEPAVLLSGGILSVLLGIRRQRGRAFNH